jgi:hypothetical protein
MRIIAIFLLIGALSSLRGDAAQPRSIEVVATILQLHRAMITPASDALFGVASKRPQTEQQWVALQDDAIILAESGNLLMLGNRAKDQGQWMKMSRALVDAGALALRAAQAKNVDALIKSGDAIDAACENCHVPYRDRGRRMQ